MTIFAQGARGPEVAAIQQVLNANIRLATFRKLEPDGVFGGKTTAAVVLYQRENPPLEPDGIVGNNTLNSLSAVNQRNLTKVTGGGGLPISNRTAGQVAGSVDCGYFSAYAVAAVGRAGGSCAGVSFSATQVYQARDSFDKVPERLWEKPRFGNINFLSLVSASRFLESLGVFGFWFEPYGRPNLINLDDQAFADQLRRATSNGSSGMMISGSNLVGGYSHWIAVLSVKNVNGVDFVAVYDPGGVPQAISTSGAGLPTGLHMYWVQASFFRTYMMNTMQNSGSGIVRK